MFSLYMLWCILYGHFYVTYKLFFFHFYVTFRLFFFPFLDLCFRSPEQVIPSPGKDLNSDHYDWTGNRGRSVQRIPAKNPSSDQESVEGRTSRRKLAFLWLPKQGSGFYLPVSSTRSWSYINSFTAAISSYQIKLIFVTVSLFARLIFYRQSNPTYP